MTRLLSVLLHNRPAVGPLSHRAGGRTLLGWRPRLRAIVPLWRRRLRSLRLRRLHRLRVRLGLLLRRLAIQQPCSLHRGPRIAV